MIELAILFRAINLYSHMAHNLTKGDTFMQDHEFFGSLYETMDDYYDAIIERHVGTVDDKVDLCDIILKAHAMLEGYNENWYETIKLSLEHALKNIEILSKSELSQGTINMLVGQADSVEVLLYKIKRRIG